MSAGTRGNGLGDRAAKILEVEEREAGAATAGTLMPALALAFLAGAAQPHPLLARIAIAQSIPLHPTRMSSRTLECTAARVSTESRDRRWRRCRDPGWPCPRS